MRHAVCRAGNPTRTTSAGSSRKGSPAEVIVKVLCRGLGEIYSSLRSLYINTRILIRVLQYRKWTSGIRCPESTHFYCAEKIGASGIAIPEVQFWYQDSRTTHGEAAESILEMNFRLGIGIPVSGSVVRTLHRRHALRSTRCQPAQHHPSPQSIPDYHFAPRGPLTGLKTALESILVCHHSVKYPPSRPSNRAIDRLYRRYR